MLAGGVESMTRAPFVMPKAESAFSRSNAVYDTTIGWRFVNPKMKAEFGVDSMPQTADNVAADYRSPAPTRTPSPPVSQARWEAAQEAGRFRDEIVPVTIPQRKGDPIVVDTDEHPRPGTTVETLGKLQRRQRPRPQRHRRQRLGRQRRRRGAGPRLRGRRGRRTA